MPRRNDNPDNPTDKTQTASTKALERQLASVNKVLAKQAKMLSKTVADNKGLQAAMKAQKKSIAGLNKVTTAQIRIFKSQATFAKQALRQQQKLFRQEKKLLQQRARGGGRGGGFGGIGLGALIPAGLAFAAFRKVQTLVEKQIQGAIVAGLPAVSALSRNLPAGVPQSRALGLLGSLQQSATLRYATPGVPLATGQLAESVKGLGNVGTELVGQFVQSLEPAMQKAFVAAVNAQGVQAAVRQYATGQNIGLATSLLNAQGMAGGETGEPLIDAAVATQKAFDNVNAAIENVVNTLAQKFAPAIEKLAGMIENMSPGNLGLAAGGALALGLGGKGLLKLGGRAGAGLVGLAGQGIAAAGAGTLAGAGAVGAAIGLPAALAIDTIRNDGASIFEELAKVDVARQQALSGSNRLANLARRTGGLRGQKLSAMARLGRFETEQERGIFKQTIGFDRFSPEDKKQIESMRTEIVLLSKEIAGLETSTEAAADATAKVAKTEQQLADARKEADRVARLQEMAAAREALRLPMQLAGAQTGLAGEMIRASFLAPFRDMQVPMNPEQQAYQSRLLQQIDLLEQDLAQIDTNTKGGEAEAAKTKAQIQQLRNEQASQTQQAFTLNMQDYNDKLNILRQQFQIARTTPSGIIGGIKELAQLQRGLADEINRVKGLLEEQRDKDTPESLREARRLQQIMLGMKLELRTLRMQEMQYLIDSFVAQAMSSGAFEKIIIDENRNLAMALERGLIESRPYITGSLGWSGKAHPVTTQEYVRRLNEGMPQAQSPSEPQPTGKGRALQGAKSGKGTSIVGANDLVSIAKAELKLTRRKIPLLEELLEAVGMEPEGVSYNTSAAQTGGLTMNAG